MSQRNSQVKGIIDPNIAPQGLNSGTPNIIGNIEDMPSVNQDPARSYPSLNNTDKEEQMSLGGDSSQFKDITSNLMRPRRGKSKTRPKN